MFNCWECSPLRGWYHKVHIDLDIQCQSKIPPGTCGIFLQNGWEFFNQFYTPIARSYLRQTDNFYLIISNFDEVMPY